MVYGETPRRRHRGRRIGIGFLVLLILLLIALVIVDRVGHSMADKKVAQQVATQAEGKGIKLGATPTVDITGFPFLTQVAAGKYDKVLVHMRDIQADAYSIPKLEVTATGVHAKTSDVINGKGHITADHVDGTATLGYTYIQQTAAEQIRKQADVSDLKLDGDGKDLKVRATVTVQGQSIKLVGATKLSLSKDGSKVHIQVVDLKPDGVTLPGFLQGLVSGLASSLSTDIALPELPYGLKITKLDPASDGMRITAAADNVALSS